ncbi:hypothetical protein F5146DRAFT_20201 [Armillaria mellea]|nr:hypothetical protein F5146DRAFT_20201 [Armillaria mellea]
MPEQVICQCLYDEIISPTLHWHSLPGRHDDLYFEPLPTKVAACPSCVNLTVEDEGPTCQDGPSLLNFSLSTQSDIQLPSGTAHVLIFSTHSSVPEHLSESTAATPNITTSESSSLRSPAAEVGHALDISSQLSSLDQGKELVLFIQNDAQKSYTDRVKLHSCVKKKKKKKRARDTPGTEEDNGTRQTKRKRGKSSKGVLLPQTHVTDKASRDSGGTRSLERRVLEDITNKVLHAVT